MVVDVGLFVVIPLLVILAIVMAVGQWVVIVRVGVPVGPVLPLGERGPTMVVGDMVVVVRMGLGGMGMLRLLAFAFGALHRVLLQPSLHYSSMMACSSICA